MIDDAASSGKSRRRTPSANVYAMGAAPPWRSPVCFPQAMDCRPERDPRGGAEKVMEAGAFWSGGHSFYAWSPNTAGRHGPRSHGQYHTEQHAEGLDKLILTKPLGVGIIWRRTAAARRAKRPSGKRPIQ